MIRDPRTGEPLDPRDVLDGPDLTNYLAGRTTPAPTVHGPTPCDTLPRAAAMRRAHGRRCVRQVPTSGGAVMLRFTVHGLPAAQGSKRHVGRGVMVESSKRVKPWRQDVVAAALRAIEDDPTFEMFTGPVEVNIDFFFARPEIPQRHRPERGRAQAQGTHLRRHPPRHREA